MSDTPITDAIHFEEIESLESRYALLVSCSRELEIQRKQWRGLAEKLAKCIEEDVLDWDEDGTCKRLLEEFEQANK